MLVEVTYGEGDEGEGICRFAVTIAQHSGSLLKDLELPQVESLNLGNATLEGGIELLQQLDSLRLVLYSSLDS